MAAGAVEAEETRMDGWLLVATLTGTGGAGECPVAMARGAAHSRMGAI